jgi:predicted AAA+ superfamily ATPase
VIDEVQKIPNIGINLKLIIDNIPDLKLIVAGSSSFDLSDQIGEPLTGRKITLTLYPLSRLEHIKINNLYELKEKLFDFLIFGSYPEVITSNSKGEKIEVLNEIVNSYLLKKIF